MITSEFLLFYLCRILLLFLDEEIRNVASLMVNFIGLSLVITSHCVLDIYDMPFDNTIAL